MKLICIALTAIWLILSGAELAYSEPVTAAIFGAAFAASFAGQAVTLAIGLAFNLGVGLIQKAMAKRKAKDQTSGISFELQIGDDQPMSFTLGEFAAGGRRKYAGIHGRNGRYFVDVIELGNLPCSGLPEFWVNDEKVVVDWNQPSPPNGAGFPVTTFPDRLWVKYYDGTQTAADPYLLAQFGADPDRPFTADMIGRGCPYIIVTARYDPEVFPQIPSILTEMPVRPVYDLRKDSSNGGNGPQRWNDQATWAPSANPIVNIYNIIRGIYVGDEWVYGGQNLAAFRLPASNWIAAANECDVEIALEGGGTEKQFRCGYEVFCDVEPLTVIEELLQTCNGRMAEVGGIFKVMVGAPGAAVFSFTDADVLVTEGQSFNPFPPFSETHNGIEATYPEPAEKWATKDAPARYDATYMAADQGQELVVGVEFEACPYKTQVQRLMTTMLREERRFRTHEFYLPPSAWRLEPNDVVSWSSDRNGYINKKFLVVRVVGRRTFNQLVSLKEIDPADYDWEPSDELPTIIRPVGPIYPSPQPMIDFAVEPATLDGADGQPRRPAVLIRCAAGLDDVRSVQAQVRVKATAIVVAPSEEVAYAAPHAWPLSGSWCLPATLFQARGKLIPYSNRKTEWSDWIDVLTPNILLGDSDVYLPGMVEGLKHFVGDATEWVRDGTRQLMLEQQRLARLTAETDIAAYTDRQTLRREVVATANDVTARVTEEIEAAAGPNSPLARRTLTLEAVIPTLATATAFNALVARVTSAEGVDTAQALAITLIEAELPNKASASALSSLATIVTDTNGKVASQADAITALSAGTTSGDTATANFRMGVSAGPAGYSSRIAMEARTGGAGTWRSAGLFIDVPASAGSPSRIVLQANQIAFTNGTTVKSPFVYEADTLFLDQAVIRQARIIDLMVGTSNIAAGAITDGGITENASDVTVTTASSGTWTTLADITVNHGTGSPQVTFDVGAQFFQNQTTPIIAEVFDVTAATVLRSIIVDVQNNNFYTPFSYFGRFVPAAGVGSTVLRLRARVGAGTTTGFARSRVIRSMTFKR